GRGCCQREIGVVEVASGKRRVLATIDRGFDIYVVRGRGRPFRLGTRGANSLWFSNDSQILLIADTHSVTILDIANGRRTRCRGPEEIRTSRLLQDGSGALVATRTRVLLWKREGPTIELYDAAKGTWVEAAERFGADLLVWSSSRFVPESRRAA